MHMWRKRALEPQILVPDWQSKIYDLLGYDNPGKAINIFMCKSRKAVPYFFRVMLQWFNNTQRLVDIQQIVESLPLHSISPWQFNILNLGPYIKPNLMILICCVVK